MLKNREIIIVVIIQGVIGVLTCLMVAWFGDKEVIWCLIGFLLSLVVYLCFTKYRYHKINQLASYLVKIQRGDYSIDLQDYTEGELSYLKNEIYKVTLTLTEQADLLAKEKQYLADVMSDISHQLKTPLTSMMMMSELLEKETLPKEKREEFLQNIQNGASRMQWLVLSLLKLSKLDAKAITLKKETVHVSEMILEAIKPIKLSMEVKNQTLHIFQRDGVGQQIISQDSMEQQMVQPNKSGVTFQGDYTWSVEAFTNIIKNCMEHTLEHGTICISYWSNHMYTAIQIEDNGKGIAKDELSYIFERFYKGKNASPESIGIGLALAKQIISMQNGNIKVESALGKGTTFLIKFYRN